MQPGWAFVIGFMFVIFALVLTLVVTVIYKCLSIINKARKEGRKTPLLVVIGLIAGISIVAWGVFTILYEYMSTFDFTLTPELALIIGCLLLGVIGLSLNRSRKKGRNRPILAAIGFIIIVTMIILSLSVAILPPH